MRVVFLVALLCILMPMANATCPPNDVTSASQLTCKQWLNGSNQTMYISTDSVGGLGSCKDFFPEWTMRAKIERVGTSYINGNNVYYKLFLQQCGARNIFNSSLGASDRNTGDTYCGNCRHEEWDFFDNFICKNCKPDGWNPPAYDNWQSAYTATFNLPTGQSSPITSDTQNLGSGWGGFVGYKGCVVYYAPGDVFYHDMSGSREFHPDKVKSCSDNKNCTSLGLLCGYIMKTSENCSRDNNHIVGCVNVPPFSGPVIFNDTLLAVVTPRVASTSDIPVNALINQYGSTFDQPVVVLMTGSSGGSLGDTLALRYKFSGDTTVYDDKPTCSAFPGLDSQTVYCAQVPTGAPDQVCVCKQQDCSSGNYMTPCTSRPTPQQSGVAVIAQYSQFLQSGSSIITPMPSVSPIFVKMDNADGALFITDASGNNGYIDPVDGNPYLLNGKARTKTPVTSLPYTYKKLMLPKAPLAIRDSYITTNYNASPPTAILQSDKGSVYGISFASSIPKLDAKGKASTVNLLTPQSRTDTCSAYTVDPSSATTNNTYPAPTGMRDQSWCCPSTISTAAACTTGTCTKCTPPLAQPCISLDVTGDGVVDDRDVKPNDSAAVKALCPGQYMWATGDNNQQDKICLTNSSDWNWQGNFDKMCASITYDCNAYTRPSVASGYATWAASQAGATDYGKCYESYGVTNRIVYTISQGTSNSTAFANAQAELNALNVIVSPLGLNVSKENIKAIQDKYPGVVIKKQLLKPTRVCNADGTSTITNSCVFMNGCPTTTNAADFTGNALWTDPSVTISTSASQLPVNTQNNIATSALCPKAQASDPDQRATRSCVTVYQLPNSSNIASSTGLAQLRYSGAATKLYQYWGSVVERACAIPPAIVPSLSVEDSLGQSEQDAINAANAAAAAATDAANAAAQAASYAAIATSTQDLNTATDAANNAVSAAAQAQASAATAQQAAQQAAAYAAGDTSSQAAADAASAAAQSAINAQNSATAAAASVMAAQNAVFILQIIEFFKNFNPWSWFWFF